jgi:hypothetical protein
MSAMSAPQYMYGSVLTFLSWYTVGNMPVR